MKQITTTRYLRILMLVAALVAPAAARAQGDNAQKTTILGESAVVRFYSGLSGSFYCGATNETYNVGFSATGSGAFINPDGYILTNAHVVEYRQMTEDQVKQELINLYIGKVARAFGTTPDSIQYNENAMNVLRSSRLVKYDALHRVLLPTGTLLPFDVMAPVQAATQ